MTAALIHAADVITEKFKSAKFLLVARYRRVNLLFSVQNYAEYNTLL